MGSTPKKPFRRTRLVLIGTAGLILIALVEPHSLRFGIRQGLQFKAWRHGRQLSIGKIEGSLFEPILFRDVKVSSSLNGVTFKTAIRRATAYFSWKALLLHRGEGFFDRLTLEGFHNEVTFEPQATAAEAKAANRSPARRPAKSATPASSTGTAGSTAAAPSPDRPLREQPWLPAPNRLELWDGDLALRMGNRLLVLSGVHFDVSAFAPGAIDIRKLKVEHPRLKKTFTNLHGTTALQGTRLVIADVKLAPDLWLKSLASDIANLSQGQPRVGFDFAAFDGSIRGELVDVSPGKHPNYEIAGSFSQISVNALGAFLDVEEKTGGTIKEGKFSFRGSPHALDQSAFSTRFEAVDFIWGHRQWNSLILGATLVNGRVQIPELQLKQAHNALKLKGELVLPAKGVPWWESEFSFDVAGRIDNLTELSALFGPRFSDTAGKGTIDGSIRGQNKVFSGQLIVAGTQLAYRGAPIDMLNAGIKLDGNEFQVINLELVHGGDFMRGKGGINIFGEKRYWAELNASVGELTDYAPLLQKPIAPAPLAGGVVVQWSGDGTLEAHSGAFTAKFRKLHTTGSKEVPATLPIDAELEGTYAPGHLFLSKCILAHDDTRVETQLAADATTLRLEALKLTQKRAQWLEGSAALPVNLWSWWQAPGVAALAPDAPFKVQLAAKGVQLDEAARLTGHPVPISGILSGTVQTGGTLRQVEMTGSVKLTKGHIPDNPWLPALDNVEAEAELDGHVVRFSKFAARHVLGNFTATGAVDFTQFDAPAFDLAVQGERIPFVADNGWSGRASLDLSITGTRKAARVEGSARVVSLKTCPMPDFGPLVSGSSSESLNVPPPTFTLPKPLDRWHYDIAVASDDAAPLKIGKSEVSANLRLRTRELPEKTAPVALAATGSTEFTHLPFKSDFATGNVETASFYWDRNPEDGSLSPVKIAARVAGRTPNLSFIAYYLGPVNHLSSTFLSQPERSDADIRLLLTQGFAPLPIEAQSFKFEPIAPFNLADDLSENAVQEPEADAQSAGTPVSASTPGPAPSQAPASGEAAPAPSATSSPALSAPPPASSSSAPLSPAP